MFKLVVLFAFVAVATAKPSGLLLSSPFVETYSAPVVHAVPSAVSSTYRKDVISKPVVLAYSAPAVVETPVVHNVVSPVVERVVGPVPISSAATHSFRSDVISEPFVVGHAQPVLYAHSAPVWNVAAPSVHPW